MEAVQLAHSRRFDGACNSHKCPARIIGTTHAGSPGAISIKHGAELVPLMFPPRRCEGYRGGGAAP